MDSLDPLLAGIAAEDRLLKQLLAQCPDEHREIRISGGMLSFKETLGHLAFWDMFAVRFFLRKLDSLADRPVPPADFEQKSREDLQRLQSLPFAEVLKRYDAATTGLAHFLRTHWHELSAKQRHDFQVPLRHRRHHRLLLAKALAGLKETRRLSRRAAKA